MSDVLAISTTNSTAIDTHHLQVLFDVWFGFHIAGSQVLLPILLATFMFTKARRDATLINLGAALMLSSICNCLLLYTNEYLGPEPKKPLCVLQAAGFGASGPMWSVAALTLILQIRSRVELKTEQWIFPMLIAPYIVFAFFAVIVAVLGAQHPDKVTRARRTLYCSLDSRAISLVSIGFTSIVSLFSIGLATTMSFRIYSFLRMLRRARRPQIRIIPLAIRLVIFMIYLFFALVCVSSLFPGVAFLLLTIFVASCAGSPRHFRTSLWSIRDRHTFIRDIYTATFGVAYFLVFGTQKDVLRAWRIWYKNAPGDTKTVFTGGSSTISCTDGQTAADSGQAAAAVQIDTFSDLQSRSRGATTVSTKTTVSDTATATRSPSPNEFYPPQAAAAAAGFGTPHTAAHYASKNMRIIFSSTTRTEA
ncbi:hypothetical protein BGW80DRAFT_1291502 [Lactifluus volemus]|nr:hypothetical protein BGW80DRAFT_1291502 [Lactifluus volemus]